MTERGYYNDTSRAVRLAGVFEHPMIAAAVMALTRRAEQRAWHWLAERGTPNAWLYWTSADIAHESIEAVESQDARLHLDYLLGGGKVGFWAIMELGASAPKVVDVGVADGSAAYLTGSPLVAGQFARERANSTAHVGQTSAMDPNTRLLAAVVAFINQEQVPGATSPSLPPEVLASLSAAARRILSSAHQVFYRDQPGLVAKLRAWAVEQFASNEVVRPQLIAAQLLWAETWKQGS